MEKIIPVSYPNYIIRPTGITDVPKLEEVTSELSVFGVLLCSADEITMNLAQGHFLRSKPKNSLEGGFCAADGSFDLPLLV